MKHVYQQNKMECKPVDMYNIQFNVDLLIAKSIIELLPDKKDREVCVKWIKKYCSWNSDDESVKKNRNNVFKILLGILRDNHLKTNKHGLPAYSSKDELLRKKESYQSHWSNDGKTYIATKPLPGQGVLLYMATSNDTQLGWDLPYVK